MLRRITSQAPLFSSTIMADAAPRLRHSRRWPRAGEQIEHMRARNEFPEHREHSLPHTILRGSRDGFRDFKGKPACCAGDDAHPFPLAGQGAGFKVSCRRFE
jgi:hypothetical protein